jgi:Uma2 family endonuclease
MALIAPRPPQTQEMRFTREDYERMTRSGVFDGRRVELIRGRVLEMAAIGLPHIKASIKTNVALQRVFPVTTHTVRVQLPFLSARGSLPEPDFAVIVGPFTHSPTLPNRALLVVEIAEATLAFDRRDKASLYAESGIADYWIINLIDRVVEVYARPHAIADGSWSYDAPTVFRPGQLVPAPEGVAIAVDDLLD